MAIAKRLLGAGFDVVGWDLREPVRRALMDAGARSAVPYEIALTSRHIVVCIPDHSGVREIFPYLLPGTILIDSGNPTPEQAESAAVDLRRGAVAYIDAPVLDWWEIVLEQGGRVVCGGEPSAVAASRRILSAYASQLTHAGPPGSGARSKLSA